MQVIVKPASFLCYTINNSATVYYSKNNGISENIKVNGRFREGDKTSRRKLGNTPRRLTT